MEPVRLVTLDPGHFHAALMQKEMYEGVDATGHVYAPLGSDLLAHLQRISGFNSRADNPTRWQVEAHACEDFFERFLAEKAGNVLILSGKNRKKIDYLEAGIRAGMHILADKPWIIEADQLARLKGVLDDADAKGLIAYDIMTERFEITSLLQRAFVNDADIFGKLQAGTPEEPGVLMESVHFLMKSVAGVPLRRPSWFFDVREQGEGLTDVGTHLVDLVQWILYPDTALDPDNDVVVTAGKRWPTVLSLQDYQRVTGDEAFPAFLQDELTDEGLPYFCNTRVEYRLRGVCVKLDVLWDYEAEPGTGDTHLAVFRGSRSRVEIRQGKEQNYRPELYIVPEAGQTDAVRQALANRLDALNKTYPGLAQSGTAELHVSVPDVYRVGHEAHFGEVARTFLEYLREPSLLPQWEKPGMLAKYRTSTEGVQQARDTDG